MTFIKFAESYGLIIDDLISDGRVHAVPTTDKRVSKKNGRYLFDGRYGWVQNWATMADIAVFKSENKVVVKNNDAQIAAAKKADQEKHEKAKVEAAAIMAECVSDGHPYLTAKGFPEAVGLVHPSGDLIIPMRDCTAYGTINGVQRISLDGSKKFIFGTRAKGSIFKIGNWGQKWLVEGLATGLSVHAALRDIRREAMVLVCFSAGNLVHVASKTKPPCFVFADNDESGVGQKAAESTGLPWGMPPKSGMDANDFYKKKGLRALVDVILSVGLD